MLIVHGVQELVATTASIEIVDRVARSRTPFLAAPAGGPEYFPGLISTGCNPNTLGDLNGDGKVNFTDFSRWRPTLD